MTTKQKTIAAVAVVAVIVVAVGVKKGWFKKTPPAPPAPSVTTPTK